MTASMNDRTVLPPEQPQRLLELLSVLDEEGESSAPALVGRGGTRVDMPDELYEMLHDALSTLAQGLAVTVAPTRTSLTTSEATQSLGVSRPTLIKLLEDGAIPYEQPDRHRKIKLADLLAYRERACRSRSAGLEEMVREAEEAGLYDLPVDARPNGFQAPTRTVCTSDDRQCCGPVGAARRRIHGSLHWSLTVGCAKITT